MDQPITEWSEQDVAAWLTSLGFSQYEQQLKEHRIAGDVLCRLDLDYLKEIGIHSLGQRLAILKAIYHVKLAHHEPVEPGDYVPPSEVEDKEPLTVDRLHEMVKNQGDRLILLEQENRRLQERLQVCFEELGTVQGRRPDEERTLRQQPSMRWAPLKQPARSPTKPVPDDDSPHASPSKPEHDIPTQQPRPLRELPERPVGPPRNASNNSTTGFISPNGSTPVSRASSANNRGDLSTADSLKTFKVSLEDPTWKVLPAALKKYKIKDEDWRNYAMFICYGTTGETTIGSTHRCLTYDEKPLLLFQKLKDAKKNPVFMLKHIKDIKSPIAQAQQKQQARLLQRAENANSRDTSMGSSSRPALSNHPSVRAVTMSNRVQALGTPPVTTASSGQVAWPETMSPVVEHRSEEGTVPFPKSRLGQTHDDPNEPFTDIKVSYAVSIYPYMAEQEDEFDVNVGDTFVVVNRAKGWWVVQKDPNGNGGVELDVAKQGWVPAGCLLETSIPIQPTDPSMNSARIPIVPANIVSTSYPGIALMDYRRKGDDELDLLVEDLLRVFKRYNHWSYVVKEDTGERGWVPSWFIGKATPSAGVPPTPNSFSYPSISVANAPVTFASGDVGSNQSPLSNSFQFAGRTSATVL